MESRRFFFVAHVKMNFHLATLIRFLLSSSSLPGIRNTTSVGWFLVTFLTPESKGIFPRQFT